MIHDQILESDDFNALTFRQQSGWFRLLLIADDQGRFKALTAWLRANIFPLCDLTIEDIEADLQAWAACGMVALYEVDGKRYGQIVNWWKYQALSWAQPSKYPAPPGWTDRVRYQAGGEIIKENWNKKDKRAAGDDWRSPDDSDEPPDEPTDPLPDEPSALPTDDTSDVPSGIESRLESGSGLGSSQQQTRARARGSPAAAAANPLGAMATLYENNIGPLTGMLRDELGALCDDGVTVEIFQYAVQQACEHNARNLAYVKAITDRVLKQGWESVRASPNGKRTSRAADMMRRTDEAAEQFLTEDADG